MISAILSAQKKHQPPADELAEFLQEVPANIPPRVFVTHDLQQSAYSPLPVAH
jgi:hypothetical protein